MNIKFENIYIDEIEELADMVIEDVDALGKFGIVGVVGHSYDMAGIFKELMCDLYTFPNFIETLDVDDEKSEYLLCVDEEGNVDIELIKDSDSGEYINYCADKLYIFGDCHSNICANNYVKDCDYFIVDYADKIKDTDECQKEYKNDCGDCKRCESCEKNDNFANSSVQIDITKNSDDNILEIRLDKDLKNGHILYKVFDTDGISDKTIDSLLDMFDTLR